MHGAWAKPTEGGSSMPLSAMVSKSLNMLPVTPETRSERPRGVKCPGWPEATRCYRNPLVTAPSASETPCSHGSYLLL